MGRLFDNFYSTFCSLYLFQETNLKFIETETEQGIFNAILRGQVDFSSDPWPDISPGAKDLVNKMLHLDPKQRLTAFEVLSMIFFFLAISFRFGSQQCIAY